MRGKKINKSKLWKEAFLKPYPMPNRLKSFSLITVQKAHIFLEEVQDYNTNNFWDGIQAVKCKAVGQMLLSEAAMAVEQYLWSCI